MPRTHLAKAGWRPLRWAGAAEGTARTEGQPKDTALAAWVTAPPRAASGVQERTDPQEAVRVRMAQAVLTQSRGSLQLARRDHGRG